MINFVVYSLGWISAVSLCLICLGIVFCLLVAAIEKCAERLQGKCDVAERQRIANELLSSSWWFSESVDAQKALELIGKKLLSADHLCVSTIRDEWRRERAKLPAKDKSTTAN